MKVSRRHILQASGLFLGSATATAALPPFAKLAQAVLRTQLNRAFASDDEMNSYYVALSLFGAPGRWTFDHLMRTRAGQTPLFNPMIVTRFSDYQATPSAEYSTVDYEGVQVPHMWSTNGIDAEGNPRALSELLEHLIVFRGYGSGVDSHPGNHLKQFAPIGTLGSISGYMADRTQSLLRAASFPAHFNAITGYRSMRGVGQTAIGLSGSDENLLNALLSPFILRAELAGIEALRERHRHTITSAKEALSGAYLSSNRDLEALRMDHATALTSLKHGFEDLNAAWNGLFNKYLNIVNSTFRMPDVPGLTDRPVMGGDDGQGDSKYSYNIGATRHFFSSDFDVREALSTANCFYMAQSLALAEFVLTRRLSHSLELGILEPVELKGRFSRVDSNAVAMEKSFNLQFDEHGTGQPMSLLFNSCFFRALTAGLLELKDSLVTAGIFDRTVIHIASDFGRAPRESGGGSDHLFDGMISSVITGRRQGGPLVLGNILANGSGGVLPASYGGTIGYKAPTKVGGASLTLSPTNVAASIGQILGFKENPWANSGEPLVSFDGVNTVARASGEIL